MELITFITAVINIVIGWYILFTIPKLLKKIHKEVRINK